MKKYKIKAKHDKGVQTFYIPAKSTDSAVETFCRLELAPKSAILTIEPMPVYVTMTDKFMSGWGVAKGKTNKLIIECEDYDQAYTIERNAKKRDEMKYINVTDKKPRYGSNVVESWKHWNDMGTIWKQ